MSCVVGLIEDGIVYLAGDSQATGGCHKVTCRDPKVFRLEAMVVGATGDPHVAQLVRYGLKLPAYDQAHDDDPFAYLVTTFVPGLHRLVRDQGVPEPKGDGVDWSLLIGLAGRLFAVDSGLAVEEAHARFNAIGCGAVAATAAFHALRPFPLTPRQRLTGALDSVAKVDVHVSGPFAFVESASC
jgi:ATP-dependent protease HslVU (ClpYQ) peptidase subunit